MYTAKYQFEIVFLNQRSQAGFYCIKDGIGSEINRKFWTENGKK